MDKEFDVAIVGGGPVGLWLACELALAKVKVVVLERRTERPVPRPRPLDPVRSFWRARHAAGFLGHRHTLSLHVAFAPGDDGSSSRGARAGNRRDHAARPFCRSGRRRKPCRHQRPVRRDTIPVFCPLCRRSRWGSQHGAARSRDRFCRPSGAAHDAAGRRCARRAAGEPNGHDCKRRGRSACRAAW